MLSLVEFISQNRVILFMLIFARVSGLLAFFPFFSHMRIPMSIKTAMAILLTIILLPYAKEPNIEYNVVSLTLAVLSEIMLGFIAGLFLYIVFAMIDLAGMQISFIMGFSLANIIDPSSNTSSPLMSQILSILALLVLLAFNGHHLMILYIVKSLSVLPLGSFFPSHNIWDYLMTAVLNMFIFGFILSFPVVGFSLLADIVFGMLMKTMPQFNLLVVGFPIKIMVSFVALIAILPAFYIIFQKQFLAALEKMTILLF